MITQDSLYYRLFEPYKNNAKVFIETGTYLGNAIEAAQEIGFEKIYSIEFNELFYNDAVKRFKDNKNVSLHLGDSRQVIKEILLNINEPCLFWLDAHDTFGTGGGIPTFEELDAISNHEIKNHTIVIDDIPSYFGNGESIIEKIKSINISYEIKMLDSDQHKNYILVAYIKDSNEN
jgi:hypothetical protein